MFFRMQAVSNFLALCRGVEVGGRQLGFAGCPVTRIMARFMLQAGDVVNRDGSGGRCGRARHAPTVYASCCC
jgi:cyclophilin family peptidyl-prolyl cis-trans isomerase